MMDDLRIDGLGRDPVHGVQKAHGKPSADFGKIMRGAINKVNGLENEADRSVMDLLQGKGSIPETMLALQKVDISMKMLLNVRNKVIEAYREVMRMQF